MTIATRQFQRHVEDFACGHCGFEVQGNGYTNHCPKCLWSRHVDINPGDRAASCGGMMKPIRIDKKGNDYSVLTKCVSCGHERMNRVLPDDDFEAVIAISKSGAE